MESKAFPILVTGASGYLASHIIKLLLEQNHKVRGTVRSLSNKPKYQFLYNLFPEKNHDLELVEANLSEKHGWSTAVDGCQYIFHVASPIPPYVPKDEMELIGPAVDGTLNVLEAALAARARKIVVTSSSLSISVGNEEKLLTENDWSDESKCSAYAKSKLRAEKAAWEFYNQHKEQIEITTVNPALILGPVFTRHGNPSETLIADIMNGSFPGIMDVVFGLVDVRDTADAHYKAMFNENTNGKRYLCASRGVGLGEIIRLLKGEFGKFGYNIIDKPVSAEEVVQSGNLVAQRQIPFIGKEIKLNNERSQKELNLTYRPYEETIIDMAYSLIKQGLVADKIKKD